MNPDAESDVDRLSTRPARTLMPPPDGFSTLLPSRAGRVACLLALCPVLALLSVSRTVDAASPSHTETQPTPARRTWRLTRTRAPHQSTWRVRRAHRRSAFAQVDRTLETRCVGVVIRIPPADRDAASTPTGAHWTDPHSARRGRSVYPRARPLHGPAPIQAVLSARVSADPLRRWPCRPTYRTDDEMMIRPRQARGCTELSYTDATSRFLDAGDHVQYRIAQEPSPAAPIRDTGAHMDAKRPRGTREKRSGARTSSRFTGRSTRYNRHTRRRGATIHATSATYVAYVTTPQWETRPDVVAWSLVRAVRATDVTEAPLRGHPSVSGNQLGGFGPAADTLPKCRFRVGRVADAIGGGSGNPLALRSG